MTERIEAKDYANAVRGKSHSNARGVKTKDGYFGSKGEHLRWQELKLLETSGEIRNLKHHERIPLEVAGVLIKTYSADFTYFDTRTVAWTIEDHKGRKNGTYGREWVLTKKLLKALLPSWTVIESSC